MRSLDHNTVQSLGSYLEMLYFSMLTFNIINAVLGIFLLPIHLSPGVLVSLIALTPLVVFMIQAHLHDSDKKNHEQAKPSWQIQLEKASSWYTRNIAEHWLGKLIWDIIIAVSVTTYLYTVFSYYDISLGMHKLSLFSQLSIIGGGIFFGLQIINYFMASMQDPRSQQISRSIKIINQSLVFALTSIVTIGTLYAEVYLYGAHFWLLSAAVAFVVTICTLYTIDKIDATRPTSPSKTIHNAPTSSISLNNKPIASSYDLLNDEEVVDADYEKSNNPFNSNLFDNLEGNSAALNS